MVLYLLIVLKKMNLKEFISLVSVSEERLQEEWNKKLEDITVKIRLIDSEGNTIKDYNFESGAFFDMQEDLSFNSFILEIEQY